MRLYVIFLAATFLAAGPDHAIQTDSTGAGIMLEDFESDKPGSWPKNWRFLASKDRSFRALDAFMNENEKFYVVAEGGNKFLRGYTNSEAQRISLPTSKLPWKLSEHPVISWDWRAIKLPSGASEDGTNDTGGAVYVSFAKTDWLGRPLSIKYTYSSTLPTGTVVSTGNVKIIVASSAKDGIGRWKHVERNVVSDYERLFGSPPPEDPYTITLWSDSDNTKSEGEVDFDNIKIKRAGK